MTILIWILAFAIAITAHEAAHAWMADRLGDPTARLLGRLSLNPIVHFDPIGSTLLVVTAILTALHLFPFPFGWAKPVRIDPYNLANPRRDTAVISVAGPFTNLALATILALIVRLLPGEIVFNIVYPIVLLNVALAIFNLIPIHPLDGGKVLVGLLPHKEAAELDLFLNRYGMLLLLFLIFPLFGGVSLISSVIGPIIGTIVSLLLPGAALI
jgi:Zn-dependent protease